MSRRPREILATIAWFTADGLFAGRTVKFFQTVKQLAEKADAATRQLSAPQSPHHACMIPVFLVQREGRGPLANRQHCSDETEDKRLKYIPTE